MTNVRLLLLAAVSVVNAGCTPAATTNTSSISPPAPVTLHPVGYRPEFGTMWTFDAPPTE